MTTSTTSVPGPTPSSVPAGGADAFDKKDIYAQLFLHAHGIDVTTTVVALRRLGVLGALDAAPGGTSAGALLALLRRRGGGANPGYLHVALRVLASLGWLTRAGDPGSDGMVFALTDKGRAAVALASAYEIVTPFLPLAIRLGEHLFGRPRAPAPRALDMLRDMAARAGRRWDVPDPGDALGRAVRDEIAHHLDGVLVGPVLVALKDRIPSRPSGGGVLDAFDAATHVLDLATIPGHRALLEAAFDALGAIGWAHRDGARVTLTPRGAFAAGRAWAYGVPTSYLPLLTQIDQLLTGDPAGVFRRVRGRETHVDRAMNVKGSGGAHESYFQVADALVEEIFNRPFEEQPRAVFDTGAGNGAFLRRIYQTVLGRTLRGELIRRDPARHGLLMVGLDFNRAARAEAHRTLSEAGVPHLTAFGDINDPAAIARSMARRGIQLADGLHVRSFLDHNRPWRDVADPAAAERRRRPLGPDNDGAYAWLGRVVPNHELEQSTVEHLRRWLPWVRRYGLLDIELHTLPAATAAAHLRRTLDPAYAATHGYSDQFLLALPTWTRLCQEAGYRVRELKIFPEARDLATVSICLLGGQPVAADTGSPDR